jgi:hypothetical protein
MQPTCTPYCHLLVGYSSCAPEMQHEHTQQVPLPWLQMTYAPPSHPGVYVGCCCRALAASTAWQSLSVRSL